MAVNEKDQELVKVATKLFEERYSPPVHSVAAALRTKSGEVFTAVNIDHFSAYVCAETAALSDAINSKNYEFDTVVAVRQSAENEVIVANMCGKCRQIFHDYAPGVNVIVNNDGELESKSIDEILPFPFTKQRKKIQAVMEGMNLS